LEISRKNAFENFNKVSAALEELEKLKKVRFWRFSKNLTLWDK
jgi:hypothetical protein